MRSIVLSVLAVALSGAGATANAKVWSVDPGGGGDFTTIQPALDAAAEGDLVLVGAGTYLFQSAAIRGKSLTVLASPAGAAVSLDRISVDGLSAGQRVVLRGLDVADPLPGVAVADGLAVTDCAGTVWIEDCAIAGRAGYAAFNQTFPGEEALRVTNSHEVTAVRCTFVGGAGYESFPFPGPSGDGVVVPSGTVSFWDCTITGGAGGTGAGDGVRVDAGALMFSGAAVAGGDAGATGLVVNGPGVTVERLDTTISSVAAPPGAVTGWPAAARALELLSPVVEGNVVTVAAEGQPGDQVLFFWSLTGGPPQVGGTRIAGTQGWYVLGPPTGPFSLATITAPSGAETFFFPAPPLIATALGGFTFLVQPYFVNLPELVAGAPSAFVLLKA